MSQRLIDEIPLGKEQTELLLKLVEADRNVPRERRQPFLVFRTQANDTLSHVGLHDNGMQVYIEDLKILDYCGLILMTKSDPSLPQFIITPRGFQYYKELKQQTGESVHRIEDVVKNYLDDKNFIQKYPVAYQKWAEAESKLWDDNSNDQLTTIGHLCREAMQEFVTELVEKYGPTDVDEDKSHVVSRLNAVINLKKSSLGETENEFLKILIKYWKSINSLVQRQEHGGQKKGRQLAGEDGRRVVFQTAIAMFEIDRSLSRI